MLCHISVKTCLRAPLPASNRDMSKNKPLCCLLSVSVAQHSTAYPDMQQIAMNAIKQDEYIEKGKWN